MRYAWLRSITNRYADFLEVTNEALLYAAHAMHIELSSEAKHRLSSAYVRLDPWPDTANGLRRLREANVRVVTLSNFSLMMLRANAAHAGVNGLFEALLSTDANHSTDDASSSMRSSFDLRHSHSTFNEQNDAACRFYEALGFVVVGRSTLDDTGRECALLHLRRPARSEGGSIRDAVPCFPAGQ